MTEDDVFYAKSLGVALARRAASWVAVPLLRLEDRLVADDVLGGKALAPDRVFEVFGQLLHRAPLGVSAVGEEPLLDANRKRQVPQPRAPAFGIDALGHVLGVDALGPKALIDAGLVFTGGHRLVVHGVGQELGLVVAHGGHRPPSAGPSLALDHSKKVDDTQ